MRKIIFILCAVMAFAPAWAKVRAVVTIAPQKYVIEKVAGDKVQVSVMVPAGASPHSYEPKPKEMTELAGADVYFTVGDPEEHVWLDKFASMNKKMIIVHTDKGVKKIAMVAHHHHDEHGEEDHDHDGDHDEHGEHEDHEDHDHEGMLDPHIWLSPALLVKQAQNAADALCKIDSANASLYKSNFAKFKKEMSALDGNIKKVLKGAKNKKFMVFHPSWGYFAAGYGLVQVPVEIEGKAPKAQELVKLVQTAKKNNLKTIFAQPQFSTKEVETIAKETGSRVVMLDPLAENIPATLMQAAKAIAGK